MTPEKVDVLICGSGSAGLCAATWLARRGLRCKILESRRGPLQLGQADGVQCRTVEIFQSFGLVEELLRESHHVLETTFWSDPGDDACEGIVRTARTADTQPGLSHLPHVILNQARVNGLLLDAMRQSNGQEVDYGFTVKRVEVDESAVADPEAFCVTVVADKDGEEAVFNAKYVLGCDGAHSAVRKSLGVKMVGDSTDSVWGVMDVYPRTDFPDIRKKAVIKTSLASLLIVPREGGTLTRFYVELPPGTTAREVRLEHLQNSAREILRPYSLDVCETVWWSAYSIGQRVADQFTRHGRVFLTGDACHTHSPKSGQGMNTSLQDGYNLGWKLAAVLRGEASPRILETYTTERGEVAKALIAFDREFAKSFASRRSNPTTTTSTDRGHASPAQAFTQQFIKSGVFTTGLATKYGDSVVTASSRSNPALATGLTVGMRFPSAQVVRHCDARAMGLAETLRSDGRWRLVIFVGDLREADARDRLVKLADYLNSERSPVRRCTPPKSDADSLIECILVLAGKRTEVEMRQIPELFTPCTGRFGIRDLHKIFIDDESYNSGHGHAHRFYGCSEKTGAMVIVRPDQYISAIIGIEEHGVLEDFFAAFLSSSSGNASVGTSGVIRLSRHGGGAKI